MTMHRMKEQKESDTNGTEDTETFNKFANERIWTFQINVFVIEKIYFIN